MRSKEILEQFAVRNRVALTFRSSGLGWTVIAEPKGDSVLVGFHLNDFYISMSEPTLDFASTRVEVKLRELGMK